MSKSLTKNIADGLNTLIPSGDKPPEQTGRAKPGRKKTNTRVITSSSQEGTKEGETRATFIVNEDYLNKLKDVAYWDRISIKEVVNAAFKQYIDKYEKANGTIKPQK